MEQQNYKQRESQTLKEDGNKLIRRIRSLPIFESDASQAVVAIQFWIEEVLSNLALVEWADNAIPPEPIEESIRKTKQQAKKEEEKLIEELQNV